MRKNGVSDDDLRQAVMEMNEGLIDADLGGGVFKKRIASHSHGKRGGSRALKALAADLLQYSDQELQKAHISKVLKEITYGNH
jgi:hypothetical protein